MQNVINPQNIKELRQGLVQIYGKLLEKKIPVKDAKELVNAAGKIINTVKAELDYAAQSKQVAKIDFMEYEGCRQQTEDEPKK